jgi:hypothetical protein
MKAIELCMRALQIATKDQKPEIRSQCQSLLNEAERIKKEDWVKVKQEPDLSESFANTNIQPVWSRESGSNLNVITTPPSTLEPITLPSSISTSSRPSELSKVQPLISTPLLIPEPAKPKPKSAPRLREPKSTRVLPVAEKTLLWRASQLNGFKFPPWDGPPKPGEFEIQDGQEPFK